MPTKLVVIGKPYKGTPVGGTVTVPDSHVKVLVAMRTLARPTETEPEPESRQAYSTRMMTAEPVASAMTPARRGRGRPRKVQAEPVSAPEQTEPVSAPDAPPIVDAPPAAPTETDETEPRE